MSDLRRLRTLWGLAGLGLAGSLLTAYAGPRAVDDATVTWWYSPSVPAGRAAAVALVYTGMAMLSLAWLGLAWMVASRGRIGAGGGGAEPEATRTRARLRPPPPAAPSRRELLIVGAMWLLPLALGPVLFSRDVYSYLAQGTLLNLGRNPYQDTPAILAQLGHAHVLSAVSPFWRHTPAPYGPLFLALVDLVVVVTGSHLIAGVLLIRVIDLVGVGLLVGFVPRLTRALGTDAVPATWLILSPLVMLELVAAGHNDVLMAGLLVAAVAIALEGRPLRAVALCALAATIKLPALAGAAFIAAAWVRAEDTPRAQAQILAGAGLMVAAVLALVSAGTGLGLSWLTGTVISTPARVHLAITPGTAIGWTVAALARDAGLGITTHGAESAFGVAFAALAAFAGLFLLYRVRIATLVAYLGVFLAAAAAGGPAAWPWYFTWGLALLAAGRGLQRSIAVALAVALTPFLVKPNGILALPIGTAPVVIAAYAAITIAVLHSRRRRRDSDAGAQGGIDPALAAANVLSSLTRT